MASDFETIDVPSNNIESGGCSWCFRKYTTYSDLNN